ncbi:Uncharacterised protein [uncultured Bacteroides sp.]|uniref:DUF4493 domain-containing protein n=1 Tax=Bacteroides cellulolyticus TaxID=2981780 RepID=UPI00082349CC|nr:DUF4493 domain-containing protein [Bacteroides cellulolyticus]MCU6772184.1 DUF4493 domain-containing protein [Bacteroides cellulolyticus]SCI24635.1 Uncharacterised protein [uncultured Bacteroides sp.]
MKKIFLICFTLLAGVLVFSACHSEAMDENVSEAKGNLNLSSLKTDVDLDIETVYVGSRADETVDVSNFLVAIYDSKSQKVEQWKYSEMPEVVSLTVGTYSIEVLSAEAPSNGFDAPFYKGTATCEIKENELVDVPAITCKLANMLFSVVYDEEFQDKMGNDVVTTISVGENSLDIPYAETRKAYLIAPEGETAALNVTLKGTIDGETIDYSKRIDQVRVGVHNIIKYEFDPVSDGSMGDGTLNVAINVDSSMNESDEVVGTNPGEEPGIDDFPTEGGEDPGEGGGEQNVPSIIGSDFNGNPFDIENDVLDIKGASTLKVEINAENGIAHLYVEIQSETLDVTEVGLMNSFDLAYPGDLEEGLNGLGFPTGANVIGQKHTTFDISTFTGLLVSFEGNHNFVIRVVDQNDLEETKVLKLRVVK